MLDGEVAIFDQALRSRFDLLRESDPSIIATPPFYMAFDVLYRAGKDLSLFPLREGRPRLRPRRAIAQQAATHESLHGT